jgi:hypothetical protein
MKRITGGFSTAEIWLGAAVSPRKLMVIFAGSGLGRVCSDYLPGIRATRSGVHGEES